MESEIFKIVEPDSLKEKVLKELKDNAYKMKLEAEHLKNLYPFGSYAQSKTAELERQATQNIQLLAALETLIIK